MKNSNSDFFCYFLGIDDSNRCNGRLFSVVPVNKREADQWFRTQKKQIEQQTSEEEN